MQLPRGLTKGGTIPRVASKGGIAAGRGGSGGRAVSWEYLGLGVLMFLAAATTYASISAQRFHHQQQQHSEYRDQREPAAEHWVDSMPQKQKLHDTPAAPHDLPPEPPPPRREATQEQVAPRAGVTSAQLVGMGYLGLQGTYGGGHNHYPKPKYDQDTGEWAHTGGEYLAFIGVFAYGKDGGIGRRQTCRATWFPDNAHKLDAFEEGFNVKLRFVVGKTHSGQAPPEMVAEERNKGQHLHINVIEEYDNLKLKMLRYFRTVPRIFSAKYYLKVDDDIYFRPDRVSHAVPQWTAGDGDFVGCKRLGGTMFGMVKSRYFDPQRHLMPGEKYFMYKAGPAFALSHWAASLLMSIPDKGLRFFGAGDASFGAWMLAFNVTHWEDRRLCSNDCKETNILAFYDTTKCNGLCKPAEEMPRIHADICGAEPTIPRGHTFLPESTLRSYDQSKEKCHKVYEDWVDHKYCRAP